MAIYRRGATFWYKFKFAGRMFRESAQTKNRAIAIRAERQRHSELEKAANGIAKRTAPIRFTVAADEGLLHERTVAQQHHLEVAVVE